MKLIFVRHGEANIDTGKLTFRGKRQTKHILNFLKDEKISAIYCSPRTRALQTANLIKTKLNTSVYIQKDLNERQLLPIGKEKYAEDYYKNYLNYDYENSHFETCKDFVNRNIKVFDKIKNKHKNDCSIVIIAHSATLSALNAYINGIPENRQIKWLQCSNAAVIKFNI